MRNEQGNVRLLYYRQWWICIAGHCGSRSTCKILFYQIVSSEWWTNRHTLASNAHDHEIDFFFQSCVSTIDIRVYGIRSDSALITYLYTHIAQAAITYYALYFICKYKIFSFLSLSCSFHSMKHMPWNSVREHKEEVKSGQREREGEKKNERWTFFACPTLSLRCCWSCWI